MVKRSSIFSKNKKIIMHLKISNSRYFIRKKQVKKSLVNLLVSYNQVINFYKLAPWSKIISGSLKF